MFVIKLLLLSQKLEISQRHRKKERKKRRKNKGGENARLEGESITRLLFRQTEGVKRESFLKWLKIGN